MDDPNQRFWTGSAILSTNGAVFIEVTGPVSANCSAFATISRADVTIFWFQADAVPADLGTLTTVRFAIFTRFGRLAVSVATDKIAFSAFSGTEAHTGVIPLGIATEAVQFTHTIFTCAAIASGSIVDLTARQAPTWTTVLWAALAGFVPVAASIAAAHWPCVASTTRLTKLHANVVPFHVTAERRLIAYTVFTTTVETPRKPRRRTTVDDRAVSTV